MEAVIIVLLVALLVAAGVSVWMLAQRRPSQEPETQRVEQQLLALKGEITQAVMANQQTVLGQVNAVDAKLNQRLDAVQNAMGQSLLSTQDTMKNVNERLGQLSQSTQQMLEVGRDISSLQDILRPPKVRGGFGELLLEQLLGQILPDEHYGTQHGFTDGARVDAVIKLGHSLVPVDSKFPLEAFNRMLAAESDEERASLRREFVRAVRIHIDAVSKYIRPEEGTFPFALMYIPAENVYYEVIVKDEILEGRGDLNSYALERKVIPVSPNSFYAYLQAIVLGLRGMRVEENAKEIMARVGQLQREFGRFRQEFEVLGTHVGRAKNKYDDLDKLAGRLDDRLAMSLKGPEQGSLMEPAAVDGSDETE